MNIRSFGSTIHTDSEKINETSKHDIRESKKRTITIKLEGYQDIEAPLPICDIQTQCFYDSNDLGETELSPVTDNENISIDHSFVLRIDTGCTMELDRLISCPALLKISLTPGVFDSDLYQQLALNPEFSSMKAKSFESVVSIYEALTDDKVSQSLQDLRMKPRRSIKKDKPKTERAKKEKVSDGKSKKQSLTSVASRTTASDVDARGKSLSIQAIDKRKISFGQAAVDFLPFFYGERTFRETLLVKEFTEYKDDRMNSYKKSPKILVSVSIDEPLLIKHSMVMHFSVESIFNFPMVPEPQVEFQICWVMPRSQDSFDGPILIHDPVCTNEIIKKKYKSWPDFPRDETLPTKYILNVHTDDIKCKIEDDLNTYFEDECFRLEFDVIKRNFFAQEGRKTIEEVIKVYKNIILEIYAYPKSKKRNSSFPDKVFADKHTPPFDSKTCLHLMAVVDVSGLLYPGIQKTRVAAPIRTFCLEEARKICGLAESYFRPSQHKEGKNGELSKLNVIKKENLDKEKKSVQKSSRSARKSMKTDSLNFESSLKRNFSQDTEKPEPESSSLIYDDAGKPCFIIVEIELSHPVIQMRDIEDLSYSFKELLEKKTDSRGKIVLTPTLAKDYYVEVLNEIILDMNQKFFRFLQDNPKYKNKKDQTQIEFVRFLQNIGAYRLYLNSVARAISLVATTETKFKTIDDGNLKICHGFIGEIFCYLISKMHETVNGLICNNLEPATKQNDNSNQLFYYAKEAAELGLIELANRYFLERVSNDENNPDHWFDYAVFFLEQRDLDRAFECVRTALIKKPNHRYSLLLFGIILDSRQQKEDAETSFLNLMAQESKWVEGWGVLYIFHHRLNNFVSMEWAMEMAKKNLNKYTSIDYFTKFQDLAWSSKRYPNKVFFRTAVLLIKMRVFDWAEMACSEIIYSNHQYANELLSVICYYKKLYSHAVKHLEDSRSSKQLDHSVIAFSAHCLLGMNREEAAKEEYYLILKSENTPQDLHLVYLNCARIMEDVGEMQEARKLVLLACKYHPTAYTWFKAGQLYYIQNDFLSAEECLSVGNSLDIHSAEIWGYLTLVNMKLMKFNEAELCYKQAIKNELEDTDLFNEILGERRKHGLSN